VRWPILSGLLLAAALPGGDAAAAGQRQADGPACAAMFQRFDLLQAMYPDNSRRYQGRSARPPVEAQAQVLRNAGCITMTAGLAGMERVPAGVVSDAGGAIRPVQIHAGVVTSMEDDARARAFFAAHGVQARSIGSAPLGRRVYIGPFATQGAFDAARSLALAAGFASPYAGDM
jgi:hypothetical protein